MFYSILVSHVATVPETLVVDAAVQGNIHSSLATQGSNFVDLINPRPEGYDSHFVIRLSCSPCYREQLSLHVS